MRLSDQFILQLQHEKVSAAKMMERVPFEKFDWKPHEKSMTLGKLATHTTDMIGFIPKITDADEFDYTNFPKQKEIESTAELVQRLNDNIEYAIERLKTVDDEGMRKEWTFSNEGQKIIAMPRVAAIRSFAISHFIHHRGQLSVYLRMLNISVPSIYGPSADEMN